MDHSLVMPSCVHTCKCLNVDIIYACISILVYHMYIVYINILCNMCLDALNWLGGWATEFGAVVF